jgi:hypothetical protein
VDRVRKAHDSCTLICKAMLSPLGVPRRFQLSITGSPQKLTASRMWKWTLQTRIRWIRLPGSTQTAARAGL